MKSLCLSLIMFLIEATGVQAADNMKAFPAADEGKVSCEQLWLKVAV